MLVVETIARIRRDHLVKGVPIKKIARDLRVSKNTIRKVVRGDETSHTYERKIQPMPKLGPWVEELERQLKANEKKARKDRLSLLRIHEDLGALGYGGGYDAVRRYARAWRRRWRLLSPSQAFVPLSFDPGEAYQFDWSHEYARLSGVTTRVKAAHMRLCYSRMQLVQIFPRESQEMVFEAHERAFRFFGGVCRRGIYDNMKTAVSTVYVGKKRDYNRRFQEMCSHHLVEPVACTPGAGWEKGQVERQVGDADDLDAVPLDEVPGLERRLRHLDPERLGLVAPRDDAAVVRRQDNGGTAFERWTEHPLAGDEEVVAIDQRINGHGRLRTTPVTTPQTLASAPSKAVKGRTVSSPSMAATTIECRPGVRERSTTRVSPARIPDSAMPSPSTATKNVAAGRLMKCSSRLRLAVGATTVNIRQVRSAPRCGTYREKGRRPPGEESRPYGSPFASFGAASVRFCVLSFHRARRHGGCRWRS